MEWDYAKQCEYIALFDADYHPNWIFSSELFHSSCTIRMLPLFKLVGFLNFTVNDRASILTRIQKTFLDYYFKVEQEAGSVTFSFFSFNGTAGVWRSEAINGAGGWKDQTWTWLSEPI